MGLTKVNYVDNVTVISAQNLNDIQDAILNTRSNTLGNTVDLDNINYTLFSYCNTVQNKPAGTTDFGYIEALFNDANNSQGIQIYYEYVSAAVPISRMFIRNFISGGWRPWMEFRRYQDTVDISSLISVNPDNIGTGSQGYIQAFYDPVKSMVKGSFAFRITDNTTKIGTSSNMFVIPSPYRPKAQINMPILAY